MATKPNRSFALKVDVSQVLGLADRLGSIDAAALSPILVRAVNMVAARAYVLSRDRMRLGINLTDDYLQRQMALTHAKGSKPQATIAANYGGIALSHYGAQQTAVTAISPIRKLKGDAARGIPRGQKQAGVSVEVSRGKRKPVKIPGVFIAPGIRDTEGNPFVFQRLGGRTRSGKERLRRLFGPAPYQLFKYQIPQIEGPIGDDLQETLLTQVDEWMRKEFS